MIGASPKFIPGTQIDVRYAQKLAREQRERERAAEEPVEQVSMASASSFSYAKSQFGNSEQRGSYANAFL